MSGWWRLLVRGREWAWRHPLTAPMASAGVLALVGDGVSQLVVERRSWAEYDGWETARFAGLACFWVAPLISPWYRFLERAVAGEGARSVVKRVAIDQCLFSPVFLSSLLVLLRALEGDSPARIWRHWREEFPSVYSSSLKVVPFAQLLNFWLVPLKYRILAVQAIAVLFQIYMTYKANYICGSEETFLLNRQQHRGKKNPMRERPDFSTRTHSADCDTRTARNTR